MNKADMLQLYRRLILARRAEEKIQEEYLKDGMKTPVHLSLGEEGVPIGVCHCLPADAKTFGTYRNHALYLAMTQDTDGFFAELYGKETGGSKGKAGSMHLAAPEQGLMATSAIVGTTIPVAVGVALANQYRGSSALVVSFFGDGAVEEGAFWESLNFACLKRLRVLFVCEDNGLAIHIPSSQRQGFRSIPEAVRGFDCHVQSDDGADVLGVIASTRQVLLQMEQQPKPGFLHLTYFRSVEHVGVREDYDAGYRRRPTPEEQERVDPVCRFEQTLLQHGCVVKELAGIRQSVDTQIAQSVRAAIAAPFSRPAELLMDVFA